MLTQLGEFFAARQCNAFLVGGHLRDSLLSLPSKDLDIALPGDPGPLGRELARELEGILVPLSPTRGIYRVVPEQPSQRPGEGSWTIDLTGFYGSIEEDLARRDFTVNALALPLERWTGPGWGELVLDPFNGRADLAGKRIRAVSPRVFHDDPARLLRAVRLAARLKFTLDRETAQLIRTQAPRISLVSGERARDEFLAILAAAGSRGQLEILDRLDLLCRLIPELAITKGVDQPRAHHYWDVWGHLLHTVENAELITRGHQHSAIFSLCPWTQESEEYFNREASDGHTRRTILKLTALLHDIAKPQTKARDASGRTRFLGHSELGASMATARLTQLRLSSRGIDMVAKMVEEHLRPGQMRQGTELPTRRAIYRYFRDLGDVAVDTLYLGMADYLAAKGPELTADNWADHARMITYVLDVGTRQTSPEKPERLISGHDLMQRFALNPGPWIGSLLARIEEARAAGEITTREEALELAAESLDQILERE